MFCLLDEYIYFFHRRLLESAHRQRKDVVAVLGAQRHVVASLSLQVLVAECNDRFAAHKLEVVVVELVETWRAEAVGVGGTEAEIARRIHQTDFRREVVAEGSVVG